MKISNINLYDIAASIILVTPVYICFFRDVFAISVSISSSGIALLLSFILFKKIILENEIRLYIKNIVFILVVFLIYIISNFFYSIGNYSFVQFLFYFLFPSLLGMQKFFYRKIIEYVIYFSYPLILGLKSMLKFEYSGISQYDMYTTYAFLPVILSSFIHFFFFRRYCNKYILLGYILNVIYLVDVAIGAVRGFWLSIFIFLVICCIFLLKRQRFIYKYSVICFTVFIFFYILTSGYNTFYWILAWTQSEGIDIGILKKIEVLLYADNFDNGRWSVYKESCELIMKQPILGYGFNSFPRVVTSDLEYPHNFILQILLDCGFIVSAIPIFIIFYITLKFLFNNYNSFMVFMLLLYASTIPQLMVSGNIWKNACVWFFISLSISSLSKKSEHLKNI